VAKRQHAPEHPVVCTSFRPPARRAGRLRHHRQILSRHLRPSRIRPHDGATGSPPFRDADAHLLSSAWREAPQLRASRPLARSQGPHCRFWAGAAVFISCERTFIRESNYTSACSATVAYSLLIASRRRGTSVSATVILEIASGKPGRPSQCKSKQCSRAHTKATRCTHLLKAGHALYENGHCSSACIGP
jgi:hypothetical protein